MVQWYAPESLYFSKFDSQSDVWSFGVTMWEIFSFGEKPYKGLKGREVIMMVKRGERLAKPPHCPKWAYELMLSCWDIEPTKRPTFLDLRKLLSTHL
eukprot:gene4478-6723_t